MDIILDIVIFIVGIGVGIALMRYSYQLTQLFGYNSLAERYLGQAGTYTMWRLLGLIVIIATLWYVI